MYLLTTLTTHAVAYYYWEHGELLPEHQGQVTSTDVNHKRALTSHRCHQKAFFIAIAVDRKGGALGLMGRTPLSQVFLLCNFSMQRQQPLTKQGRVKMMRRSAGAFEGF